MSTVLTKINLISWWEFGILLGLLVLIILVISLSIFFKKIDDLIITNKILLIIIRNINVLLALLNTLFIITPFFYISSSFKGTENINRCFSIFILNIISISINFGIIREFENILNEINSIKEINNSIEGKNNDNFSRTNSYVSRDKSYFFINIDKNNFVNIRDIPLQSNLTGILQNNRKLAAYLKSFLKYKVDVSSFQKTEDKKILTSGDEDRIEKYLKDIIGCNNVFYKEVSRKIVELDNKGKNLHSLNLNNFIDDLCYDFLISNTAFIVDNKKDNIYIPELGLCLHFPSQDLTTIKAIKFVKEKLGYKLELKKSQNN